MNEFACDMCGECCRHVDQIDELSYLDSGNGVCTNLCDNLCSIYNKRPDACNVETMYDKKFKYTMSREEYYRLNYEGCRRLKDMYDRN